MCTAKNVIKDEFQLFFLYQPGCCVLWAVVPALFLASRQPAVSHNSTPFNLG